MSGFRPITPQTRLWQAARDGDVPEIHAALADGAQLEAVDPERDTALRLAVAQAQPEAVRTLIALGANVHDEKPYFETMLHAFRPIQHPNPDEAMHDRYCDVLEQLLSYEPGLDVNAHHLLNSGTVLHTFSQCAGFGREVKILLDHGANPNMFLTEWRYAPMHYAADADIAQHLVNAGGNMSLLGENNETPLFSAIKHHHTPAAKYFFLHSQGWAQKNKSGYSPLHEAARSGNNELCAFFLKYGMDVNETREPARSVLHAAIWGYINEDSKRGTWNDPLAQYQAVVKTLVAAGADVSQIENPADDLSTLLVGSPHYDYILADLVNPACYPFIQSYEDARAEDFCSEKHYPDLLGWCAIGNLEYMMQPHLWTDGVKGMLAVYNRVPAYWQLKVDISKHEAAHRSQIFDYGRAQ